MIMMLCIRTYAHNIILCDAVVTRHMHIPYVLYAYILYTIHLIVEFFRTDIFYRIHLRIIIRSYYSLRYTVFLTTKLFFNAFLFQKNKLSTRYLFYSYTSRWFYKKKKKFTIVYALLIIILYYFNDSSELDFSIHSNKQSVVQVFY